MQDYTFNSLGDTDARCAIHCNAPDRIIEYSHSEANRVANSVWCEGVRECGSSGQLCEGPAYGGNVLATIVDKDGTTDKSEVTISVGGLSGIDLSGGSVYLRVYTYGDGTHKPPTGYSSYLIDSIDTNVLLTCARASEGERYVAIWDTQCPDQTKLVGQWLNTNMMSHSTSDMGRLDEGQVYSMCRASYPFLCPETYRINTWGGNTHTYELTQHAVVRAKSFNWTRVNLYINGVLVFADTRLFAAVPGQLRDRTLYASDR